jgi:glycosyltransferase involved in cell wall biosynthesis
VKVALYYPWLYLTSGGERTILELTGRSRHDWTVFTNRFERENTFPGLAQRQVVELGTVSVRRSLLPAATAGWRILTQRLPLERFDALVVVCEGLGDLSLLRGTGRPAICLCLTPLRIAFDPVYRARHLEGKSAPARLAIRLASTAFAFVDRLLWKRYRRVVCISEEVRARVRRARLAPESKLEVLNVGVSFDEPAPSQRFERFFLLPGRIMWTKNLELGIEAFQRFLSLVPEARDFRLVVAGIVDRKSEPYLNGLNELAGGDTRIEFRRHPSDEELAELYRSCYAVLFTAFNEDWGMVPVEAMHFGKPVIATNRGGPRESLEHGRQGFLEEPLAEAFAARMAELANDPARTRALGLAGRRRSELFSWKAFVARVDDVLDELAGSQDAPWPGGKASSSLKKASTASARTRLPNSL